MFVNLSSLCYHLHLNRVFLILFFRLKVLERKLVKVRRIYTLFDDGFATPFLLLHSCPCYPFALHVLWEFALMSHTIVKHASSLALHCWTNLYNNRKRDFSLIFLLGRAVTSRLSYGINPCSSDSLTSSQAAPPLFQDKNSNQMFSLLCTWDSEERNYQTKPERDMEQENDFPLLLMVILLPLLTLCSDQTNSFALSSFLWSGNRHDIQQRNKHWKDGNTCC